MPRRGLGRGLEAILGAAADSGEELREIAVGDIYPNPHQPRTHLDLAKLDELAASIREHGIVQPILVRPFGDRFELVAGERRWRAAQLAGLATVPAMVRSLNDRQSLEIALIENLQREDLNAIEEAKAYRAMMATMDMTQEQVAGRLGMSRPAVSNALRLLTLDGEVQASVEDGRVSAGHARTLVGLGGAVQRELVGKIIAGQLSVRQTEQLVAALERSAPEAKQAQLRRRALAPELRDLERRLRERLGAEVLIQNGRKGGALVIRYFGAEELDRLVEMLLGVAG
jgi:ParB family chromosome partitioning protein